MKNSVFSLQSQKTQLEVLEKYYMDCRDDIKDIKYHMDVMNNETGELRDLVKEMRNDLKENTVCAVKSVNQIVQIQNDVDWLKRFFWAIMTASIASLVASIFNLIK